MMEDDQNIIPKKVLLPEAFKQLYAQYLADQTRPNGEKQVRLLMQVPRVPLQIGRYYVGEQR